jgi:hypothetical protein
MRVITLPKRPGSYYRDPQDRLGVDFTPEGSCGFGGPYSSQLSWDNPKVQIAFRSMFNVGPNETILGVAIDSEGIQIFVERNFRPNGKV